MTSVIWCSAFSRVSVMVPPSDTAPEKVTKSSVRAPWAVWLTTITSEPSEAAKVTSPGSVVSRSGVMSNSVPPRST